MQRAYGRRSIPGHEAQQPEVAAGGQVVHRRPICWQCTAGPLPFPKRGCGGGNWRRGNQQPVQHPPSTEKVTDNTWARLRSVCCARSSAVEQAALHEAPADGTTGVAFGGWWHLAGPADALPPLMGAQSQSGGWPHQAAPGCTAPALEALGQPSRLRPGIREGQSVFGGLP